MSPQTVNWTGYHHLLEIFLSHADLPPAGLEAV